MPRLEHVLMLPRDCESCKLDPDYGGCPVCDGGLAICIVCSRGEIELDYDLGACPGKPATAPGDYAVDGIGTATSEAPHEF